MSAIIYFVLPVVVAIGSIAGIAWRRHRSRDYEDRIDPRDAPDGSHNRAMGAAAAAARARHSGGGSF
ncbi:hypothetical protein HD599_001507 [Conyzicola lurida]|uniref:Uncharacterized protein n=1 Tax=Conyzicola lurida TaxID=1172621 RepID=A0A841ALC4_9MICO|nr:hypothetical protein [Conyzicola lurida]MBB5843184.1 hypothetical protein [Conyzicola lurida]